MTNEYREAVRKHYFQLKEDGILSSNLLYLSPAKVKNECLRHYEEINNPWDMRTIKNFMNKSFKDELLFEEIATLNPAKFRPLIYFLNKGMKTSEVCVELTAWLLDFTTRPYNHFAYLALKRNGKPVNPYLFSDREKKRMSEPIVTNKDEVLDTVDKLVESSTNEKHSLAIVREKLLNTTHSNEDTGNSETSVMIEYPSGVRVILRSSDISLISQLVKL